MDLINHKDAMHRINTVRQANAEVQQDMQETERARKMREFIEQWKSAKVKGRDNNYTI